MSLKTFKDAEKALARYIPRPGVSRGAYTLERMQKLMGILGNPQNMYKVVHVAGTSGKTSTAYYTAALLHEAGQRVGLMVSPHIDALNERVQIDMQPLPEKVFCRQLSTFLGLIEAAKIRPTYFEILVAFGYWVLANEGVSYVVAEVGLGGLLDATNVISSADKVCVMTDIGFDHTQVLGKTLAAITSQKAGIIRTHNVVVMYEQSDEVMRVIREVAELEHAELHEIWPLTAKELPTNLPLFQRRNWYLALSVYETIRDRDGLVELREKQLANSTLTYIPARMEVFQYKDKVIILDGAHNAQKLQALVASIKAEFPRSKRAVLFSIIQSKNEQLRQSMKPVLDVADHLIITSFDTEYTDTKTSVKPLKLVEQCEVLGYQNWEIIDNPKAAYKALLKREEEILIVTGSFYLLNHIRPLMHIGK